MRNLIHYVFPLCLILFLLVGGIFLCEYLGREPSVSDVEIVSYVSPVKSSSFSRPKADDVNVVPGAFAKAVIPASSPANNHTAWELPFPDAMTLTIPNGGEEAVIPGAFGVPDNDPNLDGDQREKIYEIIKNFAKEVRMGDTYPDDPAYLARWQKAQADADDRLRLVFGQEDYLKYTLAAAHLDTGK